MRMIAQAGRYSSSRQLSRYGRSGPVPHTPACLLSTLLRVAIIATVALLSACAHAPDPQSPVVLREAQTVEVPVPVLREPPAELLQPLGLTAPGLLPAGQGDYCMTRADVEQTIDVLRAAAGRINQWRAWAAPNPQTSR